MDRGAWWATVHWLQTHRESDSSKRPTLLFFFFFQLQAIIACGECVVAQNAYMLMIQVGEVSQCIRSS